MSKKIGIIGYGWVGKAMHKLFPDATIYDPHNDTFWSNKEAVSKCDISFICVPTPCPAEGKLDMEIVEETVKWCKSPLLVIRSTVNPGTTDSLASKYKKRIVMQPEYLGETPNHPMTDQLKRGFMILGGKKEDVRELIELYTGVYNANMTIRQLTAREAEIVKLSENRAITFKVAQCQELYDACEADGTDFYKIRDAVYSDDPRFNLWWTFVFPENRGINSKCMPKDVYAWAAWAESAGIEPKITRGILEKNKEWVKGEE